MSVTEHKVAGLSATNFREIAELAHRECGLSLAEAKLSMVQSRLRHRLRYLGLCDFDAYCDLVKSKDERAERQHLISALTTNVSHFFREPHHFDTLRDCLDVLLPELRAGAKFRVWSAGCSNGQEALSIAMTMLEHAPEIAELDVRILATDIDARVIEFARKAVYPERLIGGVPGPLLEIYFDKHGAQTDAVQYAAKSALTKLIRYNELNLIADWPMRARFDIVFCRNVVIYFDAKTQETLWPNFRTLLKPDGVLFLGHSERVVSPKRFGFACTAPTTYRPCIP